MSAKEYDNSIDHQIDLDWFFNDAMGALGLESSSPRERLGDMPKSSTGDAEEGKMVRRMDAAKRYRWIADCINALAFKHQRFLMLSFTRRDWPRSLNDRPRYERYAACASEAVRAFMVAKGRERWSFPAAVELVAKAEKPEKSDPVPLPEYVAMRIAAWHDAEEAMVKCLGIYGDAVVAKRAEERAAKERRRSALVARSKGKAA